MATKLSRAQRLRTLENQIRSDIEAFVRVGNALIEIRDDKLYQEAGFIKWDAYRRDRIVGDFGLGVSAQKEYMACAQIGPKLPDVSSATIVAENRWPLKTVYEFRRLAPKSDDHEQRYDLDRLTKSACNRVWNNVVAFCEENDKKPTASIVRRFVDADLGIEHKPRTSQSTSDGYQIDVDRYIEDTIGYIEGAYKTLAQVPLDSWKLLEKSKPGLAKRLAEVCEELAEFMRQ